LIRIEAEFEGYKDSFAKEKIEYSDTLNLIEQCMNLLSKLAGGEQSLIEVDDILNTRFHLNSIKDKGKTFRKSQKTSSEFAFFSSLVTMSIKNDFSDKKLVATIVEKLTELKTTVSEAQEDLERQYNQTRKQKESQINALKEIILASQNNIEESQRQRDDTEGQLLLKNGN
jgi:hypothetical protein